MHERVVRKTIGKSLRDHRFCDLRKTEIGLEHVADVFRSREGLGLKQHLRRENEAEPGPRNQDLEIGLRETPFTNRRIVELVEQFRVILEKRMLPAVRLSIGQLQKLRESAFLLLQDDGQPVNGEAVQLLFGQFAVHPNVNHGHGGVFAEEEIAGMQVGMEESVSNEHLEQRRDDQIREFFAQVR